MKLRKGKRYDVDKLEFVRWTRGDGSSTAGYNLYDYFTRHGEYLGADSHRISPVVKVRGNPARSDNHYEIFYRDGRRWMPLTSTSARSAAAAIRNVKFGKPGWAGLKMKARLLSRGNPRASSGLQTGCPTHAPQGDAGAGR